MDFPDYPFTPQRFEVRPGIALSYLDEGPRDGEVVVMLHGNPSWSYYWRHLVLGLRDRYRCIVPDHIGMGLSDKPDDSPAANPRYRYTLQSRVDDLAVLLDHLRIIGPVTLAVHDWGGMIGFGWALTRQAQVRRLLVTNTAAFPLPAGKPMPWQLSFGRDSLLGALLIRGFNAFAAGAARQGVIDAMPVDVRHAYVAPYDSWANRIATLRFVQDIPLSQDDAAWALVANAGRRLHEFADRPAFIGWGLRDFVFDQHFLDGFVRALPGAETHAFEDAGHYVLEDKHAVLVPAMRRFLDAHPLLQGVAAYNPAMIGTCNIAASLPRLARERPDQVAMRCPGRSGRYDIALTYAQLDARSDAIASGLARHGIARGIRAVVMVRPTPEFFLLMFALFKAGAVPVLVDPGIARGALKQCLHEAQPQAFIGIPLAHLARMLLRWAGSARTRITTGRRAWLADATLAQVEREGAGIVSKAGGPQLADTQPDDVAAILFTSGSTGVPKGVVYRHRHFVAQVGMLRSAFGIEPGGTDLPTFPPFALFDPALGLTSVIPDMDPTRPARADPRKLHVAIERFGATQLFGSPALMRVLAEHGAPLPTLARVMSAGAPVPADVVAKMRTLLPDDAQFWTPYGATECLPVAVIEGRELVTLRERTETGAGTCVGRAVPPNEVRLIRVDDDAIEHWSDALQVRGGQVGEITVAGPSTTDAYFNRDAATRLAKIRETLPDGGERIVHRMGDLGYLDRDGLLWFCGRKSQRVATAAGTLCTEQIEPVFDTHPDVRRTALVGIGARGAQLAVLCVELRMGIAKKTQWPRIEDELRHLGEGFVHTAKVETFLHYPKPFPVDIRHNAKIGREKLAAWAATRL